MMKDIDNIVIAQMYSRFANTLVKVEISKDTDSVFITQDKIIELEHTEKPYSDTAKIVVDNSTQFFYAGQINGLDVTIHYGYDTPKGEYYYATVPLKITQVTNDSVQGELRTTIEAKGYFDILKMESAKEPFTATSSSGLTIYDLFVHMCAATAPYVSRKASTAYEVGEWVTINDNGYAYRCTTAGTTDSGEVSDPTTTLGETVSDGTVTWTCEYGSRPFAVYVDGEWICETITATYENNTDTLFYTHTPSSEFELDESSSRRAALSGLLALCSSEVRVQDDWSIFVFTPFMGEDDVQFEYELGELPFYTFRQRKGLLNPNKIIVKTPDDYATQYVGSATDYSYYQYPFTRVYRVAVSSDAEAEEMAEVMLEHVREMSRISVVSVPLNPALELHDNVKVIDERAGIEEIGNIKYIHREYDGETLNFSIGFGELDEVDEALKRIGIDNADSIVQRASSQIYSKSNRTRMCNQYWRPNADYDGWIRW